MDPATPAPHAAGSSAPDLEDTDDQGTYRGSGRVVAFVWVAVTAMMAWFALGPSGLLTLKPGPVYDVAPDQAAGKMLVTTVLLTRASSLQAWLADRRGEPVFQMDDSTIARDRQDQLMQQARSDAQAAAEGFLRTSGIGSTPPLPDDVGGPSAGLMLALSQVSQVSGTDLSAGRVVAGTGAIGADGVVSVVGGVQWKVQAAADAGAALFIVPSGELEQARSAAPGGMEVVGVDTLAQAVQALCATGVTGQACEAASTR